MGGDGIGLGMVALSPLLPLGIGLFFLEMPSVAVGALTGPVPMVTSSVEDLLLAMRALVRPVVYGTTCVWTIVVGIRMCLGAR